jgi:hypothetical protein
MIAKNITAIHREVESDPQSERVHRGELKHRRVQRRDIGFFRL